MLIYKFHRKLLRKSIHVIKSHETNFEIIPEVNKEIGLRLLNTGGKKTGRKHKIKEIHAKVKCYSFKNQIVSPIPSVNKYV